MWDPSVFMNVVRRLYFSPTTCFSATAITSRSIQPSACLFKNKHTHTHTHTLQLLSKHFHHSNNNSYKTHSMLNVPHQEQHLIFHNKTRPLTIHFLQTPTCHLNSDNTSNWNFGNWSITYPYVWENTDN
jgi:hypothetical protein